jgi:hypothetical protein
VDPVPCALAKRRDHGSSGRSGAALSTEDRPGLERLVERMLSTAPEAREEEESCR